MCVLGVCALGVVGYLSTHFGLFGARGACWAGALSSCRRIRESALSRDELFESAQGGSAPGGRAARPRRCCRDWIQRAKFRVCLGPVSRSEFREGAFGSLVP